MDRFLYGVSFLSSLVEHRLGGPMYYFLIMNAFFFRDYLFVIIIPLNTFWEIQLL